MSVMTILANYRDENANHYQLETIRGYTFIDTASHGYLVLGSDDNGYSEALNIARNSNYSYILDGGLVYLEEDVDANQFLQMGMVN